MEVNRSTTSSLPVFHVLIPRKLRKKIVGTFKRKHEFGNILAQAPNVIRKYIYELTTLCGKQKRRELVWVLIKPNCTCGDSAESLLSSCIPNLKLDPLSVKLNSSYLKINSTKYSHTLEVKRTINSSKVMFQNKNLTQW